METFDALTRFRLPGKRELAAFDRGHALARALWAEAASQPRLREALAFFVLDQLGPDGYRRPRIFWFVEGMALALPVPPEARRARCPITGIDTPLPHHRALALVRQQRAMAAAAHFDAVLPWPLPIEQQARRALIAAAKAAGDPDLYAVALYGEHLAERDFALRRARPWPEFRRRIGDGDGQPDD